jgi:hypothetical protein
VYRWLFLACLLPYCIALVNFVFYPKYLDGTDEQHVPLARIFTHLLGVARDSVRSAGLRGLLVESMGYEGLYKVAKDYLQPLLRTAALTLPALAGLQGIQRTAGLIVVVYVALHLLESFSSRRSDAVRRKFGGEEQGARFLWKLSLTVFALITMGLAMHCCLQSAALVGLTVAIVGFLALAVLQNLWRPLHMARFDTFGDARAGATILSVESQAKSLSAAMFAPLLGLGVNAIKGSEFLQGEHAKFIPVALAGLIVAAGVLAFRRHTPAGESSDGGSSPPPGQDV